jgi:hypothetical protein
MRAADGSSALVLDHLEDSAANGAPTRQKACARWPDAYRLVADDGTRIRGVCRSANLCAYCGRQVALENAEMLSLDALRSQPPELALTLTTPRTGLDALAPARDARNQLHRKLKARWPSLEWAAILEYSTGLGANSGGHRRPHWNYLPKSIAAADADELLRLVRDEWGRTMDANPAAVHVQPLREVGGYLRYLALHFHKEAQTPPAGYSGQRFTSSAGYFAGGRKAAREEARMARKIRGHAHRIAEAGLIGEDAEWALQECLGDDLARVFGLVREVGIPLGFTEDGQPFGCELVDVPIGSASGARVSA